jgi:tetratricopeptide (TPR) repeat protein
MMRNLEASAGDGARLNLRTAFWNRLEPILELFERALCRGERPALEAFVPALKPAERRALLAELAHAELEFRLKAAESARVEDYLTRYPELRSDPDVLLGLIRAEYRLRRQREPALEWAEYEARFPEHPAAWATFLAEAPNPEAAAGQGRPARLAAGPEALEAGAGARPALARLGDFRILDEIGRGGMGIVYRARDEALGRDVAIKVLSDRYAADSPVAQRFAHEAQITGQLQHPGIPAVHQVGNLADGRPFLAMKLIKGSTLEDILKQRPDPSADRGRLLAIFEAVCQAVGYAHAHRVIHRDLKPSNVMVGAFGEVQVMDWGLAKVLGEETPATVEVLAAEQTRAWTKVSPTPDGGAQTQAGSLVGTPAFIAPEQAVGEIERVNERSDVFGLGALLAVILTGKPPYVGETCEAVRVQAVRGKLDDCLARLDASGAEPELLALCKKCLAFEPADRPADAGAVAAAVAGLRAAADERARRAELERVKAEGEKAAAQLQAAEQRKRRKVQLALAAAVLLALTLGGAGFLYVKNERDARQAQVAREVNDALSQATALREKSRAAMTGGAALLAQAREQAQRALALVENGPADATLVARVKQLQGELDEEEKDRKLLAALDEARLTQAETLAQNRFASERAVPLFREAFAAYGLPAGQGEPAAAAERIRQRPAAVREAIVAALDEWDYMAGIASFGIEEPHRHWLRAVLAAAEPEDAWGRQVRVARAVKDPTLRRAALDQLAASADVAKVPTQALTLLAYVLRPSQAANLLRRAQQHYPSDFWVNHDLGVALQSRTPPERDEAVRFLTAAVALRPDSPGANLNLGAALHAKGKVEEAIACFHKAIALDPKYAQAHCNLGIALKDKGKVEEAIACFHKAIALDPKVAGAHNNLGRALVGKGQVDEAIACLRKAVELDPKDARAHDSLGTVLCDHKRDYDGAIACFHKAIQCDPKLARAHHNLGVALAGKGQMEEAIACYKKTIELDPKNAPAHTGLGLALYRKGKVEEAIACYQKAIELDPKDASAHHNLGNMLGGKGQVEEAIACWRKALELDPKHAGTHFNLGLVLAGKGKVEEAIACYHKAIELDPKNAEAHCNLGHALRGQGRFAESLAALKRGHEVGAKRPGWPYPSAQWVHLAERLAAVEAKLPAFLKGEFQPKDTAQRLSLVLVCHAKKLYASAARLSAAAFAADSKLAEDLKASHRYYAACHAALAAAGQGEDAGKLDDKERTRLRQQALDWLRADLGLRTRQLETGKPADRAAVQQALRHWQKDTDLAGIRDKAALAKLPADEQKALAQLWADVAALLQKAKEKAK